MVEVSCVLFLQASAIARSESMDGTWPFRQHLVNTFADMAIDTIDNIVLIQYKFVEYEKL